MSIFLDNLKNKHTDEVPLWFKKQAGRYMEEYHTVKNKFNNFMDMCKNIDAITDITMQPIKKFNLDSAIIFSDILVLLECLNLKVDFVKGKGPLVRNDNFIERISSILVDKELKFISKMIGEVEHPFVVIIGGSKIKDKITAMAKLLDKADKIIIAGGAAYTFLKARGINIGNSIFEQDMVSWAKDVYSKYSDKIVLPIDHLVSESIEKTNSCLIVDQEIPDDYQALDIGPKTIELFNSIIKGPGCIFWNGPMGVFELDKYSSGTIHVARAVALATWRGAVSVVGGGETIAALRKAEVLESEISHMSTGGGALLEYLGGSDLPGIEILD